MGAKRRASLSSRVAIKVAERVVDVVREFVEDFVQRIRRVFACCSQISKRFFRVGAENRLARDVQ